MLLRLLMVARGTFVGGTAGCVSAGILPPMAHRLGGTVATAGLSVSAVVLAAAIGAPVLATATSHLSRRRLLVGNSRCFAVANGCAGGHRCCRAAGPGRCRW